MGIGIPPAWPRLTVLGGDTESDDSRRSPLRWIASALEHWLSWKRTRRVLPACENSKAPVDCLLQGPPFVCLSGSRCHYPLTTPRAHGR